MLTLETTLRGYDPVMLGVIADRWDVDLESRSVTDILALLTGVMLSPEAARMTWERLDDDERGAMQTLLGAGGQMPAHIFTRLYGEIREMGPGRLGREKPYLNPVSIAEKLYYRGLLARAYADAAAGLVAIYVPTDLAAVLPAHHTGFDLSQEEDLPLVEDEDDEAWDVPADTPDEIIPADTTLVDDLTTVLAYLQVAAVAVREGSKLPEAQLGTLSTSLLKAEPARLDFMLGLAQALDLVAVRDGLLKPISQNARRWLEAARSEQVRLLAAAWRDTTVYSDLEHVPGLAVEAASNDPRAGREAIMQTLRDLPPDSWWVVDGVIGAIQETAPDFQRPGGDYDSWYIRDMRTDEYLRGFESWEAVEGAMLRFMLTGPLHWLGLADLGRHAGGMLGRLNAYGRAFVSGGRWPASPDSAEMILLHEDGTIEASRRLSRYDRFQLARFTEWLSAGEVYRYRFSTRGLRRAAIQGIEPRHVRAFLSRSLKTDRLPESIEIILTRWAQTAEADATIEQVTLLRTASPEALTAALEEPSIRRYLAARIGPDAVIVRPGQAAALQDALAAFGIVADIMGEQNA